MVSTHASGLCEFLGYTPAAIVASAVRADSSAATARHEHWHQTRFEAEEPPVEPLSDDEMAFFTEHYELAYNHAGRVALKFGEYGRWATDVVENAAIEALLRVARRSSQPDFVRSGGAAFLKTAVERRVRDDLLVHFGVDGRKGFNSTTLDVSQHEPAGHSPDPADEAVQAERHDRLAARWAEAVRLIRSVLPASAEGTVLSEQRTLWAVARALGFRAGGSCEDILARIAEELSARLAGAPPPKRVQSPRSGLRPSRVAALSYA